MDMVRCTGCTFSRTTITRKRRKQQPRGNGNKTSRWSLRRQTQTQTILLTTDRCVLHGARKQEQVSTKHPAPKVDPGHPYRPNVEHHRRFRFKNRVRAFRFDQNRFDQNRNVRPRLRVRQDANSGCPQHWSLDQPTHPPSDRRMRQR
jgi:hypothetical protein